MHHARSTPPPDPLPVYREGETIGSPCGNGTAVIDNSFLTLMDRTLSCEYPYGNDEPDGQRRADHDVA